MSTISLGLGVDHLDRVVVADRDQHVFAVPGELDAARALADLDGLASPSHLSVSITETVLLFSFDT